MDKVSNFLKNLEQNKLSEIDWGQFFNWKYLTDPAPNEVFIYEQWVYVFVLLNLILFVIFFQFISRFFAEEKPKYRLIKRVSFMWLINTILLLFYNIVRTEGVRFLSMRIFMLVILFTFVAILAYAVFYIMKILPEKMAEFEKAKMRSKYSRNR